MCTWERDLPGGWREREQKSICGRVDEPFLRWFSLYLSWPLLKLKRDSLLFTSSRHFPLYCGALALITSAHDFNSEHLHSVQDLEAEIYECHQWWISHCCLCVPCFVWEMCALMRLMWLVEGPQRVGLSIWGPRKKARWPLRNEWRFVSVCKWSGYEVHCVCGFLCERVPCMSCC